MSNSKWAVQPQSKRLELEYRDGQGTAHPFWIEVKRYLTIGEERRVMMAGWRGMSTPSSEQRAGGRSNAIEIDWQLQTFARTEQYLRDWSLKDDGLPLNRDSIESLDPDVYLAIEVALNDHVNLMAEEKKRPIGSASPSVT